MDFWCYFAIGCLAVVVLLYGLIDVHYFLRLWLCVLLARFVKSGCHIFETTTVSGICLSNDVDMFLYHMNNARYLRELDFARVDFYERTKLYRAIIARGGFVLQGATTIRYRKFIGFFHRFIITSKIVYWDDQSVFMEHHFMRPSDQFVHAIAICSQRIYKCSVQEVMLELLALKKDTLNNVDNAHQAEIGYIQNSKFMLKPSADLLMWIEYNTLSSKRLRQQC